MKVECFLCGRRVRTTRALRYQLASQLAPPAHCHPHCLNDRTPSGVAAAYHRWVADQADLPRAAAADHLRVDERGRPKDRAAHADL